MINLLESIDRKLISNNDINVELISLGFGLLDNKTNSKDITLGFRKLLEAFLTIFVVL